MKCPCKGCPDRNSECHGYCEKYQQFVRVHRREKEEIFKARKKWKEADEVCWKR